jgi:hypothetical protein
VASLAARREDDRLLERTERHRHLQDDAPILEFAKCGEVGPGAVAQGLDDYFVVPGAGQPVQDAARLSVSQPWQLAPDDHPARISRVEDPPL